MAISLFSLLKCISNNKVCTSTFLEMLKLTEIYPMETCFDILDLTCTQPLARENHWGNVILSYDGNASKRKIEGDKINL